MQIAVCPSRDELDYFQAGQLEEPALATIATHVDGCQACQKTLETVIGDSADTILSALLDDGRENPFAVEPICRSAVERLAALAENTSAENTSGENTSAASGVTEQTIDVVAAAPVHRPSEQGGEADPLPLAAIREYKLLAKLGEGGMGAVYKALHTRLDKVVALKVLPADRMRDKSAVARFQREMKAVGRVDHPNIVRAMDAGEEAGMHFLVMEYVEGIDLSQLAKTLGRLPIADACELVRQAALGLQEAHEHGMVHRDIKPSNLILAQPRKKKAAPTVKILDLGLALLSEALSPENQGLTSTGQMMGTIDYMAPEQGGDSHQVDIRADVYSLGATLYRLLTGSAPFAGEKFDTPVKKLMALALHAPPPVASHRGDVPPELAAVVERMMAKDPAQRYATPDELAEALAPFCHGANLTALLVRASSVPPLPLGEGRGESAPAAEIGTQDQITTPSAATLPAQAGGGETRLPKALANRTSRRMPRWPAIAAGLGGLVALALVAYGILFFIQTPDGTVRIEISDPKIKVVIDNDGNATFTGADKDHKIFLKPGPHGLTITRDGFSFGTTRFELTKGDKPRLKIEFIAGKVQVTKDGTPLAVTPLRTVSQTAWHGWPADAPPPAIAPFDAAQARQHQAAWANYLGVPVEWKNSIGMKFRLIPPGEFSMGSTPQEIAETLKLVSDKQWQACINSEGPQHKVVLSKAIYLGLGEVTQAQYEKVMGNNPSFFAATGRLKKWVDMVAGQDTADHPVEGVNWNDAAEFCSRLSELEKLKPLYARSGESTTPLEGDGYRLPTEAQWERACRAGTTTKYSAGSKDEDLVRAGWFNANSSARTHAAGELQANPFGLQDMHGNAWEWVQGWWELNYYEQFRNRPAVDPSGSSSAGTLRVIRGGDCSTDAYPCRAADRFAIDPLNRENFIGFRVALPVEVVRQSQSPGGGYALEFDGQSDYVQIDGLTRDTLEPFTFEAWVRPAPAVAQQGVLVRVEGRSVVQLMTERPDANGSPAWKGSHYFAVGENDKRWLRDITFAVSSAARQDGCYHCALVFDKQGDTFQSRYYVSGKLLHSESVSAPLLHAVSGTYTRLAASTGNDRVPNAFFAGTLDEVRLSRIARYQQDFAPELRLNSDADTLALYHFDEGQGDVLSDSSGNGHHGKIVGAKWVPADGTKRVPAPVDQHVAFPSTGFALEFDGQTSYVEFPTFRPDFSQPFTFEAVVEPHSEKRQSVAGAGIWPSVGKVFSFVNQENANYWMAFNHVGGGWAVRYRTHESDLMTYTLRDKLHGVRHHIAGVWTGEQFNWFVDGQPSNGFAQAKPSDPSGGVGRPGIANMGLEKNLEGITSRHFRGTLDEVRISRGSRYHGAYTPKSRLEPDADTLALYHFDEGQGDVLTDSSGNNHHGKIVGAKWVNSEQPPSTSRQQFALSFEQGGQYVEVPGFTYDPANPLTIEAIVQGSEYKLAPIVALRGEDRSFVLLHGGDADHGFGFAVRDSRGTDDLFAKNFDRPGWLHVCGVWDGKTSALFVDGEKVGTATYIERAWAKRPASLLLIGGDKEASRTLGGKIRGVRISSHARYGAKFKPPLQFESDSHTLALYDFLDGPGDVLTDSSGNNRHGKVVGAKWVKADGSPIQLAAGWHGWPADAPPPAIAPFDAAQAKEHQQAWAEYLGVPVEWENSFGMKFRLIPPGTYTKGLTEGEAKRIAAQVTDPPWSTCVLASSPQQIVTIARPFFLGVNEVSRSEYLQMPKAMLDAAQDADADPATWPATRRTFWDAVEYCNWLNDQAGLQPAYETKDGQLVVKHAAGYRLPVEEEWEMASRAGTATRWPTGDDEAAFLAKAGANNPDFWRGRIARVGQAPSNAYGFHDMHGNVWEWCENQFGEVLTGPATGARAIRGGGFRSPDSTQSGFRFAQLPEKGTEGYGIRLCLSVDLVKRLFQRPTAPPAIAPFDAAQAKAHQEAWAKHLGVRVEYTNSLGMKFRLIPPGEFLMGSTPEEIAEALRLTANQEYWKFCINSEAPQHKVILTQPIYLGVHEITQADYEKVMGSNPSFFAKTGTDQRWVEKVAGLDTASHPVEGVSWNDAAEFCARLSDQEKLKPFYSRSGETVTLLEGSGYRLPTEAEWEFACRAGTTTKHWTGETDEALARTAWFNANAGERTHNVGELSANPLGLFDIQGNVWEWVQDGWEPAFYGSFQGKPAINPVYKPATNSLRVFRGGVWNYSASCCRASFRHAHEPLHRTNNIGFRVALSVEAVRKAELPASTPVADPDKAAQSAPLPAIVPFDAAQAKAHQVAWAKHHGVPVEVSNSLGMKFRLVPPGEYLRGSTADEIAAALKGPLAGELDIAIKSEAPAHRVRLTRAIYVAVHEVTQKDYETVVGKNPAWFSKTGEGRNLMAGTDTGRHPVENINWDEADQFTRLLSCRDFPAAEPANPPGVPSAYRLPTEAEWEFFCRAGTTTAFWTGATAGDLKDAEWLAENSEGHPHTVGQLAPNPFGLCDVAGNVAEWCQDGGDVASYAKYGEGITTDPVWPRQWLQRTRGGPYSGSWLYGRSAFRNFIPAHERWKGVGLRVVLSVDAARQLADRQSLPPAIVPFDAAQAKAHQKAWAKHLGVLVESTNSIGMKFVLIPPGEFTMGTSNAESVKLTEEAAVLRLADWCLEHLKDESPEHRVTLSQPLAMSVHEVTRGQFRKFVAATRYKTDAERDGRGGRGVKEGKVVPGIEFLWNTSNGLEPAPTDNHPVMQITWNDAVTFCEWLSSEESVTYRLPTEAEWEFACRAGNPGRYCFGDDATLLPRYAWYAGTAMYTTHEVGQRQSNAFGMFDMHGNVREWCLDGHGKYTAAPATDPLGAGEDRVLRGGTFGVMDWSNRSPSRAHAAPDYRNCFTGFRVVQSVDAKVKPGAPPAPLPPAP